MHPRIEKNKGAMASRPDSDHVDDAFPRMVDMVNDTFGRVEILEGDRPSIGSSMSPRMEDYDYHEVDVQGEDDSPKNIRY